MAGLPIGPFKEVFQIVEERFPRYGHRLTSAAGLLIVIGIILACLALIFGIIGRVLNVFGIVHWPSMPSLSLSGVPWILAVMVLLWFTARALRDWVAWQQNRGIEEREEVMITLLREIRDKLSRGD